MSIGAGRLKGRRLAVARGVRPSSRRLKEALFSIWVDRIPAADVLDVFAGSGGVGIEAWSRGARTVTFVESGRGALVALGRNLELVGDRHVCRVVPRPAERALAALAEEGARFDLLFVDPPYAQGLSNALFRDLRSLARDGASLAVEHRKGSEPGESPEGWQRRSVRRYGDSGLSLFEPAEPPRES